MRIALVAQEDPFYLPPAVLAICRARRPDFAAIVAQRSFNEKLHHTARRLHEFYGPLDFSRLVFRYARAKTLGRLSRSRPYSVKSVARMLDIPLYTPQRINAPEFLQTLADEIRPDLILSIAASEIFKPELLSIPPLGCINLHSAPLPKYQGMMPVFWTMYHGESEGCVTVHHMAEKLDAGDIILQRPVSVGPSDSLEDMMIRCKEVGVAAVLEAIDLIERGEVKPTAMDKSGASYFSFPKREHAARLRAAGRRLLR